MIPKEKAIELLDKYVYYVRMYNDDTPRLDMQKECVLIAINELIEFAYNYTDYNEKSTKEYWEKVKIEIEKL
jgi:hypothetical protein